MSEIQRWKMTPTLWDMSKDRNGIWVLYVDHCAELEGVKTERDAVIKERKQIGEDASLIAYIGLAEKEQLNQSRARNAMLVEALQNVERVASRGDVNIQPLLVPILDYARRALAQNVC